MSAAVETAPSIASFRPFMTVWIGQTVSVFGSQITAFALSIWIFHESGSVITFGLVIAAQLLPAVLLAPLAGVLIDSLNRRKVLLACDVGMLIVCLPLLHWAALGQLDVAKILYLTPVLSLLAMVHGIAYSSSIALLVPQSRFGSANAMVQLGNNSSAVVAPVLAVVVLEAAGPTLILLINVITYLVAAGSLALTRFPYDTTAKKPSLGVRDMLRQQRFGFAYLLGAGNRVLLALLAFLAAVSLLNGLVQVLFRPMILITESPLVIGWLVTVAGIGGLAGAMASGLFVNRFNKVSVVSAFSYLAGVATAVCGLTANNYAMGVVAFSFSFAIPVVMVASQTLWQLLVPVEYQGRVFAVRAFLSSVILMVTIVIAPVLAELVLEPAMREGAPLATALSGVMESGPGRGIGLMFVFSGLLVVGVTYLVSSSESLRRLRDDAPGQQSAQSTSA